VLENVVEHLFLTHVVSPFHGLVEHHEKEPIERLGKKSLEQFFIFDMARDGHGALPRRNPTIASVSYDSGLLMPKRAEFCASTLSGRG
jgi:hypothetical protein